MKIFRGASALMFFCSVLALQSCAQRTTRVEPHNTLWRVESGDDTLYLLGSVHALSKESYPLDPAIETAFDRSDVLVLEIAVDSLASNQKVQMEIMSRGMMSGNKTLRTVLPDSTYSQTAAKLQEMGLGIAILEKFKPWVVAMLIAAGNMQQQGFKAELGIDSYFQQKARAAAKPVIGLESVDFQLGLFDGLSEEEQVAFLQQTLQSDRESPDELLKIVAAWKKGDTKGLESFLLTPSMTDNPSFMSAMVTDRNRRWIPAIEGFLKDPKTHIVVVGALHLVGSEGVVALLREKGYTVEQL